MECSKQFSITVDPGCMIDNASPLPEQTAWEFYSVQLTASGGVGPYTFALTAGAIAGGSISSAGLIDSELHNVLVYTFPVVSNFTITATDSDTPPNTCSKDFQLTCVDATDCPNWENISWAEDPNAWFTPSLATGAAFTANIPAGGALGSNGGSIVFNTTDGCTLSEMSWTWNVGGSGGAYARITITSSLQGILVQRQKLAGSAGSETRKFALQPGNHTISIVIEGASNGGGTTFNGSIAN